MKIFLIISFDNCQSYLQNIDSDNNIQLTTDRSQAKRFNFGESTFRLMFVLVRMFYRLNLSPIYIFENESEKVYKTPDLWNDLYTDANGQCFSDADSGL